MELLTVVVNYKTYNLLDKFTQSYQEFVRTPQRRLVVVDVENDDDSWEIGYDDSLYRYKTNIGYARAVNDAIANEKYYRRVVPDYYGIFNADTRFVDSNCVDSCLDLLECNDDIGVVGPMQYNSDGKLTHAGIVGPQNKPTHRGWMQRDHAEYRDILDVPTVSGSAYFIKRTVWEELTDCQLYQDIAPEATGAFLPTQHFYEETYCSSHALAHGHRVMYNGEAEMIHEWHQASPVNGEYATKHMRESREYFCRACDHHGIEHD